MKFSYQWIKGMVSDLGVDAPELERLITMKTAECEGVERVGEHFSAAVAARVLTVEPLPKGKNKRVTIDAGDGAIHTVVCGAPNVRPGLLTAWLPPGTHLGGRELSRARFDSVESEGMLASAAELSVGDDDKGLIELLGLKAGDRLPGLHPDWVIEIDNKSLTHRPDLWGHYGLAREVAAIAGGQLVDPVDAERLPKGKGAIEVEIADYELCARYSALVVENVRVAPSPLWLQFRLESVGMNPISNVVDVTNHVLAELPQPMHAFDADKLSGNTIFVRLARAGEKLKALNGEEYALTTSDLVIADAAGPIAIAGVIGGADSAISATTTRIVLESANFHPASVRLTSARHKLRTDASMRFEKSLDPENTVRGLARAVELIAGVCPEARAKGGVADSRGALTAPEPIRITVDFISKKLGKQLGEEQIRSILSALGFGVEAVGPKSLLVSIPSWRATKDISLKDDLVEEIGRIVGYGEITPAAPLVQCIPPAMNPVRGYHRKVRLEMAAQGFTEVYNYSFVNQTTVARFGLDTATHIAVKSPIAAEHTHMRRSLLPGLFQNIVNNTRNYRDFRIFEIGREIHPRVEVQSAGDAGLPDEMTRLVAALYIATGDEQDFFELKRVLECVFPSASLRAVEPKGYEHPTRAATVEWRGEMIGRLFELHPALLAAEGLDGRAFLFDVDLDAGQSLAATEVKYVPLRKYPTSGFDLSVVAALRRPVADIQRDLVNVAGGSLAKIDFVRQYAGPPLPEGQKSVSYRLEVGSFDHTLASDEVSALRNQIIDGMRAVGYELRV
ncbi:MAG: phenylalanine--tRNA ligase subunit beta [Bryobacteraceae bacterium]